MTELINHVHDLEEVVEIALSEGRVETLSALLMDYHPADIADVLERLPGEHQAEVFRSLPMETAIEVLHELGTEATRRIVADLSDAQIARYLDQMPMDEVAAILTQDAPERMDALLEAMRPEDAREVRALIGYPPESAGRLMTEKFVRVRPHMTVEQVLAFLRRIDPEVETLNDIYVVDSGHVLVGVVSLRELITTPDYRTPIREIMTKEVITVGPDIDQEEAARLIGRYDFLAMPVVSANRRLLGIITVDDAINILSQETTEDALKFGGMEGGVIDQPYFTIPIWKVVRARVGWLLLLFLAETFTGSVLRAFEHELQTMVALSFFIPLLIGTGGNTGAQTVATVIRGLALRDIQMRDTLKVMIREMGSGLLLGLLLGGFGVARTLLWGGLDFSFALVIGLALLVICAWANTIGALIPLLARRFHVDPAIVSAPLITTLVDATGLLIYLSIARALLGI